MDVHGVPCKDLNPDEIHYADNLFDNIRERLGQSPNLEKVPLYWGSIDDVQEKAVLDLLNQSPLWKDVWFREFRETQVLKFVGDAALYISRLLGAEVVQALLAQASKKLQ